MLDWRQLKELVIEPALQDIGMLSDEATYLLLFTCAVESNGGTYLKQIKGPALGIYQMEPATYNDIWHNYIVFKQQLSLMLGHNFNAFRIPSEDRLIYDLRFASAMARIHYVRVKEALPGATNVEAIYDYYKKYYNTGLGKADKEKCLMAYKAFIV